MTTAITVAALYVDPRGVYAGLPGVDVWDEARDARPTAPRGPSMPATPWRCIATPSSDSWPDDPAWIMHLARAHGATFLELDMKRSPAQVPQMTFDPILELESARRRFRLETLWLRLGTAVLGVLATVAIVGATLWTSCEG